MEPDKRELRALKREVKKRGNKHRRQQLKRDLEANPEVTHMARPVFGRHQSARLNGLDRDATRRRSSGSSEMEADRDRPDETDVRPD